jgi:hypothetical protein
MALKYPKRREREQTTKHVLMPTKGRCSKITPKSLVGQWYGETVLKKTKLTIEQTSTDPRDLVVHGNTNKTLFFYT